MGTTNIPTTDPFTGGSEDCQVFANRYATAPKQRRYGVAIGTIASCIRGGRRDPTVYSLVICFSLGHGCPMTDELDVVVFLPRVLFQRIRDNHLFLVPVVPTTVRAVRPVEGG